jgi:hypothetical protein
MNLFLGEQARAKLPFRRSSNVLLRLSGSESKKILISFCEEGEDWVVNFNGRLAFLIMNLEAD